MVDYNTLVPRAQIHGKLRKFDNIITVAKTGYGDYVCSDAVYGGSDAACIQAALDYILSIGGGILYIIAGHYNCNTTLTYRGNNLYIFGDADNTILDFSTLAASGLADTIWDYPTSIHIYGNDKNFVPTVYSALTVNASIYDTTVTVADGTKFAVGDWIRIRSEAEFNRHPGTYNYHNNGEIQQIKSISGNVITIKERILMNYLLTDTATVDLLIIRENIRFDSLRLISSPTDNIRGIVCEYCSNLKFINLTIRDFVVSSIGISNTVNANVSQCDIAGSTKEGLGYGFMVGDASRNITGTNNHFAACRHAVACGGSYSYGIQFNQIYTDNSMSYDIYNVGMFGQHNSYDGMIIANNICTGCSLGYISGMNNIVDSNTVIDGSDNVLELQQLTKNTTVSNNHFKNHSPGGAGVAVQFGNENVSIIGNHIDTIAHGIYAFGGVKNLTIDNNTINSNTYSGIEVTTTDDTDESLPSADTEGVHIRNNKITTNSNGIRLYVVNASDIRNIDITDNNVVQSNNTYPAIAVGGSAFTGFNEDIKISGNQTHGGTKGITLASAKNILVSDNLINDATTGIIINSYDVGCSDYFVQNNKLHGCTTDVTDNVGTGIVRNNS